MSYSANVFNVMIASPSDVSAERQAVREVIYRWNAVNSQTTNVVLLPIGWETHASPDMSAAPQNIINVQVLENSDILIGVFWTRLGTPTGDYHSGTVEEIERHISSGKLAMLYFSEKPINPTVIDRTQYDNLVAFKSSCFSRGLCSTYNDVDKFKEQLYDHLQQQVQHLQPTTITQPAFHTEPQEFNKISIGEVVLVKAASLDSEGVILRTSTLSGGVVIETNGLKFIETQDRRKFAKMDSALNNLLRKGLITQAGMKGQVFKVTGHGYDFAERVDETQLNEFIQLIDRNEF